METIPAPLKGKIALVTGGSRGIGAGIAYKLASHGATHIAVTYKGNKDLAEKVLASIRALSPKIKTCALQADLVDPDFGPHVVENTLKGLEVDHLDIVVSCAANLEILKWQPMATQTKAQWDEIMTSNAWAPISLARESVKHMSAGGRIVLISSISSVKAQGDPYFSYCNSKAALESAARNLALMYAVKPGVTVNSVQVGPTKTKAIEDAMSESDEARDLVNGFSMFKRIGEVEEVANIVAFVASPAASWMTGNAIPAYGGGLEVMK